MHCSACPEGRHRFAEIPVAPAAMVASSGNGNDQSDDPDVDEKDELRFTVDYFEERFRALAMFQGQQPFSFSASGQVSWPFCGRCSKQQTSRILQHSLPADWSRAVALTSSNEQPASCHSHSVVIRGIVGSGQNAHLMCDNLLASDFDLDVQVAYWPNHVCASENGSKKGARRVSVLSFIMQH